jgi:hypothetical protein
MLYLTRAKGEKIVFRSEETGAAVGVIYFLEESGREFKLGLEGFEGLSILRGEVRPRAAGPLSRARSRGEGGADAV